MNYLGLDLSLTATGFYLIREDGSTLAFEINTKPDNFATDIERADHIANAILSNIASLRGNLFITLEDYFTGKNPGSAIKLATLGTMVRYRLLKDGFSFIAIMPMQIKKFETGSGNAPKDNILKSVFKRHGFDTNSNNVADACAMAYTGKGIYEWQNGKTDFTKTEKEVLKKIVKERAVTEPYSFDMDKVRIKGESK